MKKLAELTCPLLLAIAALFICASCTTPAKIFHAPNDAKVKAAASDLSVKVARARETAQKAKQTTEEAKALHDKIAIDTEALKAALAKFGTTLPAEYQGPLREITDNLLEALLLENADLKEKLRQAVAWNVQLDQQNREAETARQKLQVEQDNYAGAAIALAQEATLADQKRYNAERQNVKNRLLRFLWGSGLGVLVIGGIVLVILWKAGKFGVKKYLGG